MTSSFVSRYSSEDWQKNFLRSMASFILKHINWIGVDFRSPSSTLDTSQTSAIRVLDYACGPGTITNTLGSHATEYIGVDLSEGMVQAYNTRFQPTPEHKQDFTAHAVIGNLLEATAPTHLDSAEYFNFDLAMVGVGFHHFSDVQLATDRLTERLKPGGVLMIVDFLPFEKNKDIHMISHHGFSIERVKELFGNAGLTEIDVVLDPEVWMMKDSQRSAFMAKGRKPAERRKVEL